MGVETLAETPRPWNRDGHVAVAEGFAVRFVMEDLRRETARFHGQGLNGDPLDKLGPGKGK